MSIEDFVAKTRSGIDGLGFLFGAGTSFESGYPLISGLTRQVVDGLKQEEVATLHEVLAANDMMYDTESATPNVEEISDLVTEHYTNSKLKKFGQLVDRLKMIVSDVILSIHDPDLSNHVAFFEALKRRSFDRPTTVWIFTTNYDLLVEDAASEVGVKVTNGFSGVTNRFFSEKDFTLVRGTTHAHRFSEESCLCVRLVKLHGSTSWYKNDGKVFEKHPGQIDPSLERCMVLPRRRKVVETLTHPYDRLFSLASNTIGRKCGNIISSGFSFSDDHINNVLINPKIETGSIALVNFCCDEPVNLTEVRSRPNLQHICKDKVIKGGRKVGGSSEYWKFGKFVTLF